MGRARHHRRRLDEGPGHRPGAKVDLIIVTNDPGFVPVDNGAPNNGF